ncbi:hypothetical protein SAMN05443428_11032 [Caloramator quimbayensis]|uniref:Uncharacterized protein n=1 Tax=Caloramator quimbayensis TaxID=1147123 RepID=A0A1T4XLU3_9CLOT|nr:hypothetical protein [Caloramator quimbayensis]SKA90075.1 hypothetical protein SAMN05443428_11032 [Caloramator quimbayensis]
MGKPSIFSSKYEQQMKRRRINIILIILILISAAYFGGKYYLNKNNINININIFKNRKTTEKKAENQKSNVNIDNTKNTEVPNKNTNTSLENEKILSYEYKTANGLVLKIDYKVKGDLKEFLKLEDASSQTFYDISEDKKYIIFDDITSNDIILADINGNFKKLTKTNYKSTSTNQTYEKDKILSSNPQYVWSRKPHFTKDGRIVYISQLPYFRRQGEFYLWVVKFDGSGHKKVGLIGNDLNGITYDGYDSEGNIRIKSQNAIYYLKKGAYSLSK